MLQGADYFKMDTFDDDTLSVLEGKLQNKSFCYRFSSIFL